MSKELSNTTRSFKDLMQSTAVEERFNKLLGENSESFITSCLQLVNASAKLKLCDPVSILNCVSTAAALNLNINPNFGYAYVIPYETSYKDNEGKWQKRFIAQFQMGYKGFIQLAQRSCQYKTIIGEPIYGNQFKSWNPITEKLVCDFTVLGEGEPVGYVSAFELLSGFRKTIYWTKGRVNQHAKKYSKTFQKMNKYGKLMSSPWNDPNEYDKMAIKTLVKMMLSMYGPMEIKSPFNLAMAADQSMQIEEGKFDYLDNPNTKEEPESDKNGNTVIVIDNNEIVDGINACENLESILQFFEDNKVAIQKDIQLITKYGAKRKQFEDAK